jgi:malic enzyme
MVGLFKGILARRLDKFTPQLFIAVAEALAAHKPATVNNIVPDVFDQELVGKIYDTVMNFK